MRVIFGSSIVGKRMDLEWSAKASLASRGVSNGSGAALENLPSVRLPGSNVEGVDVPDGDSQYRPHKCVVEPAVPHLNQQTWDMMERPFVRAPQVAFFHLSVEISESVRLPEVLR